MRVLRAAERIVHAEDADLEIVIPAALLHDFVISPKHNPRSRSDSRLSAAFAKKILNSLKGYPPQKIALVYKAILECSFTKGIKSDFLEGKILQDADRLDTVGALGIMRAFATTGQLQVPFYSLHDPFCQKRKPAPKLYTIDFLYVRSLKVESSMNTRTGRLLAQERTNYVKHFLGQLMFELKQVSRLNK